MNCCPMGEGLDVPTSATYVALSSTDGGATWTQQDAAGWREWSAVAMSADGKWLAAAPKEYPNLFVFQAP
jgi:hypothetical protein